MLGKIGAVLIGLCCGLWYFHDNNLDSLKGKRVLVTGASTGIGEQLAYQYASFGCRVVVTSRRLEALKKVTKRCEELSPQNYSHHAVAADMQDMNSARLVVEGKMDDTGVMLTVLLKRFSTQAIQFLGGLDILVLNHIGPHPIDPFFGSTENISLFDKTIDVNVRSYVHLTSYAMSQLIANEGNIVVISSLLGRVHHPFLSSYAASKHALHGFFGSLRSQFVSLGQNVAVTICTLGYIGTDSSMREINKSGSALMKSATPASPESTAKAIVISSTRKEDEMFYPYAFIRALVFMRGVFPQTVDSLMRYVTGR